MPDTPAAEETARRSGPRGWLDPSGRPSRRIAVGVVVTVLLGVVTFVVGKGVAATIDHSNAGNVWLRTIPRGSLTLVDGVNGRVSAQLGLPSTAGHDLQVSEQGDTILVYDPDTGIITRVNAGTLKSGGSRATIPGVALVAGANTAYLVDYGAATVQRIDLTTLATTGPTVRVGGQIGQAGIDATGTLWVPRVDTGQAVPIGAGGAGAPVTVARGRSDLSVSVVGGKAMVVDAAAGRVGRLSGTGVDWLVNLPQPNASWIVPPTEAGPVLPLVSTAKGTLDVVDVGRRQVQAVPLGAGAPRQVGPAIANAGHVYIPDYDNGRVLVFDPATGSWGPSFDVVGRPGPFDAVAKDGIVYFNNPNGPQTVVVGGNGVPTPLNKYNPPARKKPASNAPLPGAGTVPTTAPLPVTSGGAPGRRGGRNSRGPAPKGPVSNPGPPNPGPDPAPDPAPDPGPDPAPDPGPDPGTTAPPLAPQNVRAAPNGNDVGVTWTIPSGGGPVTSYTVTSQPSGAQQSVAGTATSATVTGLDCATAYQFTVTAVGPAGQTTSGASTAVHPCTTPAAPSGVTASGQSDGSIQVSWSTDPGAANYRVGYQGPTSGTTPTQSNALTIPASSLTYLGTYTITVYAANTVGTSPGSTANATAGPAGQSFTVDVTLSKTDPNGCQDPATQSCRAQISHDAAYDGNVAGYAPQGSTITGYCQKAGAAISNDNGATSTIWVYTTTGATGYVPGMWLGGPGAGGGLPACPF